MQKQQYFILTLMISNLFIMGYSVAAGLVVNGGVPFTQTTPADYDRIKILNSGDATLNADFAIQTPYANTSETSVTIDGSGSILKVNNALDIQKGSSINSLAGIFASSGGKVQFSPAGSLVINFSNSVGSSTLYGVRVESGSEVNLGRGANIQIGGSNSGYGLFVRNSN